ncbi:ethionine resistance protein [Linderina macrospora]|uniref:Ethionine resistance protein n=1 Tax=Linderina macrospora TaxID=4868 RepID=A0ACC1J4A4_9FUNG|nr:ethionine resistance protein [Linderina macrospora]
MDDHRTSTSHETSPLLSSPSTATLGDQILIDDETNVSRAVLIKQELAWLVSSSIPLALSYFCQSSFAFVSMLNVGRLGVNELAAASLSVMIINFVVMMPCVGLACALETFCSTAFTASRDKTRVGFHMQRGLVAVTLQLVPTVLLFVYMDSILQSIGQTEEVATLCGEFLRVWLLGSWPLVAFECLKRFVQAQGIMQAGTWVMAAVAPIHFLMSHMLVWSDSIGIGFAGAPLATAITNWLLFLGLTAYIACSKAKEAWGGFTLDCLDGIWEFYRLAIPSAAMMSCSWSAFEMVTFGSSMFGPVSLAAQACIFSAMSLTYQTPAAIGSAAATRVGNSLGCGKQRRARFSAYISMCMGYAVGMTCSLMLFLNRYRWGYMYSDVEEVVTLCSELMPYFAAVQTYDGMNGLVAGILRALGKQSLGAILAFPSFWVLAVPIAFYLGMGPPHLEVIGLWLGLAVGVILYSLAQQCYILFYIDWRHEVKVCLDRLARSTKSLDPAQFTIAVCGDSDGGLYSTPVTRTNSNSNSSVDDYGALA